MSRKLMIQCDNNPGCKSFGEPEWVGEGKKANEHRAPYGWLEVEVYVVGRGPNVKVEVCSLDCLTPAVEYAIKHADD